MLMSQFAVDSWLDINPGLIPNTVFEATQTFWKDIGICPNGLPSQKWDLYREHLGLNKVTYRDDDSEMKTILLEKYDPPKFLIVAGRSPIDLRSNPIWEGG